VADPGAIVVSPSTRRLLGDLFNLRHLGPQTVKGFAGSVEAWTVQGVSATESRFEAVRAARLTGFVGRKQETEMLLDCKRLACRGDGQIVLVSGEAGVGKSRLGAWLAECIATEPHTPLRYQCSPYHTNSALCPFTVQLERLAGIKPDDVPERRIDKLEALLATATSGVEAVAPLFAALLSIPFGDRYPPLKLSPAQQRRQTLTALLDQLEGLARRQAVLLFEDAHWADATSLELLDRAIERIRHLPVLAIITFRPELEPPWAGLPNVTALPLGRLDQLHVQTMMLYVS
jgi:predicted ATPase